MKATGVVRQIDELGRVTLPAGLRRKFGIGTGDPVEILVDGDAIVLRKYQPGCVFCGETDGTKAWHGKRVCGKCQSELANLGVSPVR